MVARWKKEVGRWYFAFLIVVLFTFMLVALCAVLEDPKKGLASAEAASWVQAIGTVAALFAAYILGERQAQHALRTATAIQDREHDRKKAAFLAICLVARDNSERIGQIFFDSQPYDGFRRLSQYQESSTADIVKALRAIPVHDVGSAVATTALLNLIQDLSALPNLIEAFDGDFERMKNDIQGAEMMLRSSRNEIGRRVHQISQYFKTLEGELGATG